MTDTEPQPSDLTDFQKARHEAAVALGLDIARLNPADSLKLDLCVVLRRVVDSQTESAFDGDAVDLPRLLTAIEKLTALLPAPALSASAPEVDPRQLLLEMYMAARARGELFVERSQDPITPSESDVVPPSEQGDLSFFRGPPKPAPDDYLAPVIEREADEDAVDIRAGFGNVDEPWRQFSTDVEGNPLTARGRRY
jgi:hypothetical protein